MSSLTANLITTLPDGTFVLVLVEEGPWTDAELSTQLRRIQDRLYDCLDCAVDGHLAKRFPESIGKPVLIRLNCFNTPDEPVQSFVTKFESHVRQSNEIQQALVKSPVSSISFEYRWAPPKDS